MPRPCKRRRICAMPKYRGFAPIGRENEKPLLIIMTVDEYETIRLIDLENLSQEECAQRMQVARTTVQAIYNNARKKLARCLIEGGQLNIEGGEYIICEERLHGHGCKHCRRKE